MIVEYPHKIFSFNILYTDNFNGNIKDTEENYTQFMDIDELLRKDKKLSNIIILDKYFRKNLIENNQFKIYILVDEFENVLKFNFETSLK